MRIEEAGKITYSNIVVAEWGKGTTISVYPNPASEKIYLTMASFENTPVNLRLVNPLGQEIWGENVSVAINENYRKEISLASLAKGVYILEVTTLGGKQTYKLIIQ